MSFRMVMLTAAALVVAGMGGCDPPARHAGVIAVGPPGPPPPPAAAPAEPSTTETPRPDPPEAAGVAAELPSATEPAPAADPVTQQTQTSPQQLRIQLSAGVAVPQSLPGGTQIGVSVDYEVRGELHRSSRYYLVVESNAGETRTEVTLAAEGGTIQGFCPVEVRPEHQPFFARIDEHPPGTSQPMAASNRAPLKTSY